MAIFNFDGCLCRRFQSAARLIWFGFSANANLLAEWSRHVVTETDFHDLNGPINLSLKGQLTRSLTAIDYSRRVADKDYPQVNFLSLSEMKR